ncbi:MAG: glycosyltransferase family 4 protein [Candidatus Falkowbacteria bacterium]|nr:glycosyltransferase family 4 protein [Candidatus Falkowbacteria bacterium]
MKIAQVVCAFPPYAGGIGNSAYTISQLLATRHEVTNFYPDNLKPWLKYGHSAFAPQLLFKLGRFDYIYLHYPFFGTAEIVWLFKIFNKKTKLIVHYHMDVSFDKPFLKLLSLPSRLIRANLLKRADIIVSASLDYIKNGQIKNIYQKYPDKFQEIPFGLDLNRFKPDILKTEPAGKLMTQIKKVIDFVTTKFIKKDKLTILFVGGLDRAHYFKGVNNLIKAASELANKDWVLKIAGEGELELEYRALAADLEIGTQVKFCGKLGGEELIKTFQSADVLVLPSINRNEAFGLVLIEAMACGTPVIASNLPGVRSVFTDGQEGFLIEPDNVADLKNKLELILRDNDGRQKMSQAARRLAEEKYGLELMKEKILNLFG